MGFQGFPVSTRLRAEAGDYLDGDLTLRGGAGVVLRYPDAEGEIQADAVVPSAHNPSSLFVPGAVTSGELVRLHNPLDPVQLLAYAQAHCATAPGAGTDASNYWALRLAGSHSGQIDLPLDVQGTSLFALDARDGATAAGRTTYEGGGTASLGEDNQVFAVAWDMTATVEVESLDVPGYPTTVSYVLFENVPLHVEVREIAAGFDVSGYISGGGTPLDDETFPVLARSAAITSGLHESMWRTLALDRRITLSSGRRYFMCIVAESEEPASATFPDLTANRTNMNVDGAWRLKGGVWQSGGSVAMRARGSLGWTVLQGDLVVSGVEFGAGATPPQDINLHLISHLGSDSL